MVHWISNSDALHPMTRKPRSLVRGVSVLVLIAVCFSVQAGIKDRVTSIFEHSVTYHVKVTDASGRSLPGAILWYIKDNSVQSFDADLMTRLVQRYHADADYVFDNSLLRPLLVSVTDESGEALLEFGEGDVRELKKLRMQIAAIKRGYQSSVKIEEAPIGSEKRIALKLTKAEEVDPRMEEFDILRARARNSGTKGMMTEERQALLQEIQDKLQRIAAQLEKDGRYDDASAVYYNLAYIPSVNIQRDAAGHIVSRGYSSTYDEKSATRRAYLEKALELNRSHPQISYKRLFDHYRNSGALILADASKAQEREQYIADTEQYIRDHGERMWPGIYVELWQAYQAKEDHDSACAAIRQFYAFEPSYFSVPNWHGILSSFRSWFKLKHLPPVECTISQLPPREP